MRVAIVQATNFDCCSELSKGFSYELYTALISKNIISVEDVVKRNDTMDTKSFS